MYQVLLNIFECMKGKKLFWVDGKEKRKKMERKGLSAYPVSSKDIDYNVNSGGKGGAKKGERESDKERILKIMEAKSDENIPFYPFSILIYFDSWFMIFARYGKIW